MIPTRSFHIIQSLILATSKLTLSFIPESNFWLWSPQLSLDSMHFWCSKRLQFLSDVSKILYQILISIVIIHLRSLQAQLMQVLDPSYIHISSQFHHRAYVIFWSCSQSLILALNICWLMQSFWLSMIDLIFVPVGRMHLIIWVFSVVRWRIWEINWEEWRWRLLGISGSFPSMWNRIATGMWLGYKWMRVGFSR